ncbi:MAG: type IV secretory system conjugative DNA transfer family protein [Streptomyces sp.]|nr:type IV secretory system conjugative DNA transfer family protein [Streptomyces sp.]
MPRRPILDEPIDYVIAALIIVGIGGALTLYLAGQLAGLLFEFAWPHVTIGQTLQIAKALPKHWGDPKQAWPIAARADLPGRAGFIAAAVLALALLGTVITVSWRQIARRGTRRVRGFASGSEVQQALSTSAVTKMGTTIRPSLEGERIDVEDVGTVLGRRMPGSAKIALSAEESVLVLAAARQGKTSQVMIPMLHRWRGPAIATSVRRDIVEATASLRALIGPILVLAPTGMPKWPKGVQWSPAAGCHVYDTAKARAETIVRVGKGGSNAQQDSSNAGFFGSSATNLVAAWLHAAALTGGSMNDVVRWSLNQRDDTAVRLLRDHPDTEPGVADMLADMYASPQVTKANLWATATIGLSPLMSPTAREVFCGPIDQSMDIENFLRANGTLYVLVSAKQAGGLAPIISAFIEAVTETAKHIGDLSPGGRLDPPLAVLLDEAANVSPLPDLPDLLSYSGGSGIFVVVVLQNMAQAADKWGPVGAEMIWGATTAKVILGGLSGSEVDDLCRLAGEYQQAVGSLQRGSNGTTVQTSYENRPVLTAADVRGLSTLRREALVFHGSTAPVRIRMTRHYEGPDRKLFEVAVRQARAALAMETAGMGDVK